MLERKIEKDIAHWLHNSKKALLVEGARQVGKTYIIRETLKKHQCHYIEFNLIENHEIAILLEQSKTVNEMIERLSLFTDKQFIKNETVIFFDEIQEFKNLTSRIKFWVDEGSFKYVLSGSLLGVELKNIKSAPVGYLTTLSMFPLDFEEFLQLYNFNDALRSSLQSSFVNKTPVNDVIHERMMSIFTMYLCVGGMPAAVAKFQETRNLEDVMKEHLDIITQYKKDFTRYEVEDKKPMLTRIYDLIPVELADNNKRFNLSSLQKGLRYNKSEDQFVWLSSAGVALPVYNVTSPTIPLLLNEKASLFKLFLSDIGMLTTLYGKNTKIQLITHNKDINNGAIYENIVAQELKSHGFKLYYYNNKRLGELDFVVEYNGKVLPLEIKSGKDYQRHSALNNVLNVEEYHIDQAIVFSNYNITTQNHITYYPIYMLMFLTVEDITFPTIEIDDLSKLL